MTMTITYDDREVRAAGKKPLIGESRALSTTIAWQVGQHEVAVGSPMEYAAVQQFGAKRGQFGRTKRGAPIPWGDIPARPFLGVSDADRQDILAILAEHWQAKIDRLGDPLAEIEAYIDVVSRMMGHALMEQSGV